MSDDLHAREGHEARTTDLAISQDYRGVSDADLQLDPACLQFHLEARRPALTAYRFAIRRLPVAAGRRCLDYGCGTGEQAVILAARGLHVVGIDLSQEALNIARRRAEVNGVADRVTLHLVSAHDLPFADGEFPLVYGNRILHHLDLTTARRTVLRVLQPGGTAVFNEPYRNSALLRVGRRLIPLRSGGTSPFEAPLTAASIQEFALGFTTCQCHYFGLLSRLQRLLPRGLWRAVATGVGRLDLSLLHHCRWLSHYAQDVVIELRK